MGDATPTSGLPATGLSREQIRARLDTSKLDPIRGHFTRAFRPPLEVQQVGLEAYMEFLSDNAFFSMYLPYIGDLEGDLMRMCTSLFHPHADSTASPTSGGSDSIYCGIHAAREWGKVHRPGATQPEVLMPYSAHAAFDKACHYFGLKPVRTPLREDFRADVDAMNKAITKNTVCIVGSAPCWSFGRYDPLTEIAALAGEHGLWMHVDACVGGYLAPFYEKLGRPMPVWDFRLPQVKSISADLHKYGYCPKPMSTILWAHEDLLQYHYYHPENWPAGPYKMKGLAGSRSAGPVFAAWSVMSYLGEAGYLDLARKLMATADRLAKGIAGIDGLEVFKTDLMPFTFRGTSIDLEKLIGVMFEKGWVLLGNHEPPLINMPLDAATTDEMVDLLVQELAQGCEAIRSGKVESKGALRYG